MNHRGTEYTEKRNFPVIITAVSYLKRAEYSLLWIRLWIASQKRVFAKEKLQSFTPKNLCDLCASVVIEVS
jgi:hypothetical protein